MNTFVIKISTVLGDTKLFLILTSSLIYIWGGVFFLPLLIGENAFIIHKMENNF